MTTMLGSYCQQVCSVTVDFDKDFVPLATGETNQSNVIRLDINVSCDLVVMVTSGCYRQMYCFDWLIVMII